MTQTKRVLLIVFRFEVFRLPRPHRAQARYLILADENKPHRLAEEHAEIFYSRLRRLDPAVPLSLLEEN